MQWLKERNQRAEVSHLNCLYSWIKALTEKLKGPTSVFYTQMEPELLNKQRPRSAHNRHFQCQLLSGFANGGGKDGSWGWRGTPLLGSNNECACTMYPRHSVPCEDRNLVNMQITSWRVGKQTRIREKWVAKWFLLESGLVSQAKGLVLLGLPAGLGFWFTVLIYYKSILKEPELTNTLSPKYLISAPGKKDVNNHSLTF